MDELLKSLAVKTLNLTEEQLAEVVYESDGKTIKADAVDRLVELDAERIKKLRDGHKAELTKMHDEAYSKAKGEALTKYEENLKKELGIQTDAKGIDLIKEIVSKNSKIELDEEKVKLHPRYLELEKRLNNEFISKQEYDKVKAEFDQFKTQIETLKVSSVVSQDAVRILRSLKPILPKDPAKAAEWENTFVSSLLKYDFELQSDGSHIIKKDGKRLETANGYPVSFADFVKSEADKRFDFEIQDPKGNAGNSNTGEQGTSIVLPQSESEYMTMLANEPDPHKAVTLMKAWELKNKK